jgi:hypothetical protein
MPHVETVSRAGLPDGLPTTLGSPLVSPGFAGCQGSGLSPAIARRATLVRPGNRLS